MTRTSKAIYLKSQGEDIVWDHKVGRIFFLEINGQKFKRTPDDQMLANELIDEIFDAYWDND